MGSLVVVVIDKLLDVLFQIAWQEVILQHYDMPQVSQTPNIGEMMKLEV